MRTRSSPPHTDNDTNLSIERTPRCEWVGVDEAKLIEFLIKNREEAGDSMTFKASTWNAAAEFVDTFRTKGGRKSSAACSNKWNKVRRTTFNDDHMRSYVIAQRAIQRRYDSQELLWSTLV
jgi:hypothetical protein